MEGVLYSRIIDTYIAEKYTEERLKDELRDSANIYHLLYYNGNLVGFSRIFRNVPYKDGTDKNIPKPDRIFLLEKVYNLHLGKELLWFNLDFMKHHHQKGTRLFVWIENERAIHFYKRNASGLLVVMILKFLKTIQILIIKCSWGFHRNDEHWCKVVFSRRIFYPERRRFHLLEIE